MKVKFLKPRLNREAGSVEDSSLFPVGIVKTLLSLGILEEVEDGNSLDSEQGESPTKSPRKPRRSKKASTTKRS
jgi:hypothetical protein